MGLTLSPAGLVFLFPEFFAQKASIGGFKSPCSGIKIKHDKMLEAMAVSTFAYMEHRGVIRVVPTKRGRIFKRNTLAVVKQKNFDPRRYGYLSYKIGRLYPGRWITMYDALVRNIEVEHPTKYMISRVFVHDLANRGLFYQNKASKPVCQNIYLYSQQANWLRNLYIQYYRYRGAYCKIITDELKRALGAMQKREEIDWDVDIDIDFSD